jgi:hypothetical protein
MLQRAKVNGSALIGEWQGEGPGLERPRPRLRFCENEGTRDDRARVNTRFFLNN